MNLIPPIALTDAMLHSCTIAEPSATDTAIAHYHGEYSAVHNYGVDEVVLVAASHLLYISLVTPEERGTMPIGCNTVQPKDGYLLMVR
jgi:hypothetical protein